MKTLLIVTAAVETATSLALLGWPSLVAWLLLGGSLDTPAALVVARVTGAALLALGVACWLTRNDAQRRARGLVTAMLFYNAAVVAVFVHAGLGLRLSGIGLWSAAVLHAAMTVWCVACLWSDRVSPSMAERPQW